MNEHYLFFTFVSFNIKANSIFIFISFAYTELFYLFIKNLIKQKLDNGDIRYDCFTFNINNRQTLR